MKAIIADLDAGESPLLVMATGTGKTRVFTEVMRRRMDRGRILVVAHRRFLLDQIGPALTRRGMTWEIEQAENWAVRNTDLFGERTDAVLAMVQTVRGGRLKNWPKDAFDLIVVDETHRAAAQSYRRIFDHFSGAQRMGVTATPDRGDGVGLGGVFTKTSFRYPIAQAIDEGYLKGIDMKTVTVESIDLSRVRLSGGDLDEGQVAKAMMGAESLHGIIAPLIELAGDRPTAVFAPGVQMAIALCETGANYVDPSILAVIHQGTSEADRRRIFADFADGRVQFIFNDSVLTEGWDSPNCACIAMVKQTKVRARYEQCIGRGLRLDPKYDRCLVLNFRGAAGGHRLITPADCLAGKPLPDDVAAEVDALQAQGARNLEEILEEAKKRAADKAAAEERARILAAAASAKAEVTYSATKDDPFAVDDELTEVEDSYRPRASDLQVATLVSLGVDKVEAETLSEARAGQLIGKLQRRLRAGGATWRQMKVLKRYGLRTDLKRREASTALSALAENKWKVSVEIRERFGQNKEGKGT